MNLVHIFSIYVLCEILVAGKPDPPKDIKINAIGKNANISWTIPIHKWKTTLIELFDSKGNKVLFNYPHNHKYVRFSQTSYEIVNLTLCAEYVVTVIYSDNRDQWSNKTKQHFWMTNITFTAETDNNVALLWRTGFSESESVAVMFMSNVIYDAHFGFNVPNTVSKKYKFELTSKDTNTINITVIRVEAADAGLYKSVSSNVDGCCLLVVTAKPTDPTLTIYPEHPFVNSSVTFTCFSLVQRWPGYIPSNLSYQFFGNSKVHTEKNSFIVNNVTNSDKGRNISCQATDDRGKVSIISKNITLDPYYGPDNVVLQPVHTAYNVTEGTTLGPIRCTVTCNPKCLFKWRWGLNEASAFKNVLSNETLVVENITENQSGIYRCRVVHPTNKSLHRTTDISVNVQYSPKIKELWLSDKNATYGSRRLTNYSFSEGNNLTVTLRIKSNPDPQIVIHSSLMTFPTLLYTKLSDYFTTKLPSLKCENSGNFTIHASNGIAYGDKRTVNLEIKCKPRDVKAELKIGTKVDTDVNIVMNVVSFPTPTVTWLRMTKFVWTVLKDKYDYKHNISSTIRITSKDDFGVHGIKICNTLGCIVENITLQPEDKPEAPLYFSVEKTTSISVNLSWIVGFNGGHEQTFSIQFKTTDSDQATKIVQTSDTKTGSKVYYILDQLKPDTLYHVMVLSTNKYGNRNASLEFKTEVEYTGKSTSKTTSISTLSIVLACGYPVLFAVIIVLLVYINRRNKGSTGGSNPTNTNSTNSDEYTVIQRGNPTFTEPYSTLQSPTESTALQADSMETDTYDECGIITDVEVNQTMGNR